MHVSKAKNINFQRQVRDMFTGEVHASPHSDDSNSKELRLNLVKFSPGGRTKWHRHSYEQGLVIMEGKGIVATEGGENVVEPGDVVIIPANEKHWHGGTESTGMAHISINQRGESIVMEPVTKVKTQNP